MTLGYDDEYSERGPGQPAERERLTDFSRMAQSGAERLELFHERHFAFVQAFMQGIYPGSTASLTFGSRSRYVPSLTFMASVGGAGGDYQGLFYSVGLDLNIPLDVLRRMEISIGPRLSFLLGDVTTSTGRESMTALLYGARLAFMGTFDARLFNRQVPLGVGLHTEFGGGHNFNATTLSRNFSYMEVGGFLGHRGNKFTVGIGGGTGVLDLNSPTSQRYIRLGLEVGGRF